MIRVIYKKTHNIENVYNTKEHESLAPRSTFRVIMSHSYFTTLVL